MSRTGGICFLAMAVAAMAPGCAGTSNGDVVSAKDLEKRQAALAASDLLIIPGERIGPIALGMSRSEVTAKLGRADQEIHDKKTGGTSLFFYDLNLAVMFDGQTKVADRILTYWDPWKVGPDGPETFPLRTVFKTSAGLGLGASAEAARQAYRQYVGDSPSDDWLRFPKIGMECHTADGKVKDMTVMKAEER